jgi:hypothetical protein
MIAIRQSQTGRERATNRTLTAMLTSGFGTVKRTLSPSRRFGFGSVSWPDAMLKNQLGILASRV